MSYVPQITVCPDQPRPIRIRAVSNLSNGERKPRRENPQALVKGKGVGPWGVPAFCWFVCKFLCALIAFLIALQWKCENLLGEKQSKFTETSTPRKDRTPLAYFSYLFQWYEQGNVNKGT